MTGLRDLFIARGTIMRSEPGGMRMRAIAISCPALRWTPGQQIHMHVGGRGGPQRTYSIWQYDGSALELRVFDHGGDGPGVRWARTIREGAEVEFSRPVGDFVTSSAAFHLFVGEETAQVAFGPMLRALPPNSSVHGVLEIGEPDDRLPLTSALNWQYRYGATAASSATLVDAVRHLDLPDGPGVAYVAGEARTVQAIRGHLVRERRWPRRAVRTKPFWTPGKTGLE
jgi:NADPH-dependent ferric siderophore reductase